MPQDPLLTIGSEAQRALFARLVKECRNEQIEAVVGAAMNLIVNALRQTYRSRADAETYYDACYGRNKQLLLDHYDATTGRLRTNIPFPQVIHAAHLVDKDKF